MDIVPIVTFRRVTYADAEALHTLVWPQQTADQVAARLADPRVLRVVACHNDAVIAYGELVRFGTMTELANLTVADDWRGRGVGTQLIDHLTNYARRTRVRHLHLTVNTDNDRARRLYERLGFRVTGTLDTDTNALFTMEKRL